MPGNAFSAYPNTKTCQIDDMLNRDILTSRWRWRRHPRWHPDQAENNHTCWCIVVSSLAKVRHPTTVTQMVSPNLGCGTLTNGVQTDMATSGWLSFYSWSSGLQSLKSWDPQSSFLSCFCSGCSLVLARCILSSHNQLPWEISHIFRFARLDRYVDSRGHYHHHSHGSTTISWSKRGDTPRWDSKAPFSPLHTRWT